MSDLVKRLVESKKEEAEKTPQEKKEGAEAPKVKPPGIPIDQPVKPAQAPSDTKRSILEAAVKKVNEEEKKILDKFGGTIVEMDKVPGNEGKDYKNTVFVNAPKNPEKFVDKDGKPIPPRVVYHFHGNGGKIGDSATAIMDQVERMRANGENVILVMPQDNQGHWKDMENPAAFKDMQKMVESMTGGKPIKDISISSFSGGYKGVEKVLKNLRANADKDPESKKLYKNIRQLGFLDSAYGGAEEFAEWAKDKNHTLFSNYTAKCENGNKMLEEAVRKARGGDMEGITITGFNGIHGNAPLAFMDAMKGRPSTAGEEIESVEVTNDGPRIPERSPDAMTGAQFRAELKECERLENPEEAKRALWLNQLSLGNVPDKYRNFQRVKVVEDGVSVEFGVGAHELGVGTDGDFVPAPADGLFSGAAADAYNCTLPTAWLAEQIENQGQWLPLIHQGDFAQELGLDPKIVHGAKTWSADFILKHDEKTKEWAKRYGRDWGNLSYGHFKEIVHPIPGVTDKKGPDRLEMIGGRAQKLDENGNPVRGARIQRLSGGFHSAGEHDYSQGARLVAKVLWYNGREITAAQAKDIPELMDKPRIAEMIRHMNGELPTYNYRKDPVLSQYVDRMRKGLPSAVAVTTIAPSSQGESPATHAEVVPSTTPSPPASSAAALPSTPAPPVEQPITQQSISGPAQYAPSSAPSSSPETYTGAAAPSSTPEATTESTPEPAKEQVEAENSNKRYIVGDSLSMGFASYLKGPNTIHLHSKKENDSTGAHTAEMLNALKSRIQNQNVEGATLVIVGGTNDIFGPDSLEVIMKNLNEMYTLAKEKGMKVVAATLPPVGHSKYGKDNWAYHKSRFPSYEDYNDDLIKRWRELNTWITGRKGTKDEFGRGPDEVVEFHKVLENPDLPGSLSKDNYGEGGIHLKDYSVMGNSLRDAVAVLNPQEPGPEKPAESADPGKPAVASSNQPSSEQPPSKPESTGPLSISSETKVDIKPANDPTKDVALGQNAEIRKNISGYSGLQQVSPEVGSLARQLLGSRQFGDIVYFSDGTNEYAAIKEWHPPYPQDSGKSESLKKWHHGISVVKKNA